MHHRAFYSDVFRALRAIGKGRRSGFEHRNGVSGASEISRIASVCWSDLSAFTLGACFPDGIASMAYREKSQTEPDRGWLIRFPRPYSRTHWLKSAAFRLPSRN